MHYRLITSAAELEDYLSSTGAGDTLAIDTEFFRETTYFPQLGLVQLASDGDIACVDPLAFDSRDTLARVLLDDGVRKLFHSCSQDLEVLLYYLGGLPCPVHDTQVATALVTDRDQMSYADVVARYCGVELEKSQTRTNWLKRPLSEKQLVYAAEDVHYLPDVYDALMTELDRTGRRAWFEQDCERLCANAKRFEPDFDRVWLRVKGTQRLGSGQLAVVDALARWREQCAIELDVTRRQIASDEAIVAAAQQPPGDVGQLTAHGKWHRRLRREDFELALAAIAGAQQSDPGNWPQSPRHPQDAEHRARVRELMQVLEQTASELGVAQAALGSRKEIEKLLEGQRDLPLLQGWRAEIVGERLLTLAG